MKTLFHSLIFLCLLLAFAACNAVPVIPPTAVTETAVPSTPTVGPNEAVLSIVEKTFGLDARFAKLIMVENVEWPDGCLGVVKAGVMGAMVITPGYRVVIEVNQLTIELHTNQDLSVIQLAPSTTPAGDEIWMEMTTPDVPCQRIAFTSDSVFSASCGKDLARVGALETASVTTLENWIRSGDAFLSVSKSGTIVFYGQGREERTLSEKRSLAEWMQGVFDQVQSGRTGAAWGLVMAWHRQGGIAGFCDDLGIYADGEVIASSCKGSSPSDWLAADYLDQLYRWVDEYQRAEIDLSDGAVADSMSTRLVFEGRGSNPLTDEVKQQMLDYASRVFMEVSK